MNKIYYQTISKELERIIPTNHNAIQQIKINPVFDDNKNEFKVFEVEILAKETNKEKLQEEIYQVFKLATSLDKSYIQINFK